MTTSALHAVPSSLLTFSTRTVFSNWRYIAITAFIAATFSILFNMFDQLLFFSPILSFYIPADARADFILSSITAVLLGVVVSLNIYALKNSNREKRNKNEKEKPRILPSALSRASSLFSGFSLSVLSVVCVGCSSSVLGLGIVYIFGATTISFLSEYHTSLRVVSIAILAWAFYSVSKTVAITTTSNGSRSCNTKNGFGTANTTI